MRTLMRKMPGSGQIRWRARVLTVASALEPTRAAGWRSAGPIDVLFDRMGLRTWGKAPGRENLPDLAIPGVRDRRRLVLPGTGS
jgi:hypothetical protein